jgi:hypothetical protein
MNLAGSTIAAGRVDGPHHAAAGNHNPTSKVPTRRNLAEAMIRSFAEPNHYSTNKMAAHDSRTSMKGHVILKDDRRYAHLTLQRYVRIG